MQAFQKYKAYKNNKDSGIKWLGMVPEHWNIKRLRYVARQSVKKPTTYDSDKPYIGLEHVQAENGLLMGEDSEKEDSTAIVCNQGNILFGKLRPYLVKVIISEKSYRCSSEFLVLKTRKNIKKEYLYYLMLCKKFIDYVNSSTYGAKMPRTSWEFIRNIYITIPPKLEQQKIVAFLDRETSKFDQLVEKKERLIELLKEKRQAIITQVVTKGLDPNVPMKDSGIEWLGEVPKHWTFASLKHLRAKGNYAFVDGPFGSDLKNEEHVEEGVPLIQLNNIDKYGRHLIQNNKFITPDKANQLKKHKVYPQNIVIAKMAEPVARAAIVKNNYDEYVIVADCIKFVPNTEKVDLDFLIYSMNSAYFRNYAEALATGTTRLRVNLSIVKNLFVLLPPLKEQQKIVGILQKKIGRLDELICKLNQQINKIKEYRQTLISDAVTGQIDVRDEV